jgi:MFS family permease
MELIAPEILDDARGLSLGLTLCGLVLGLALWLLGWRKHRFWVVLLITLGGGVYGLSEAPSLRTQPILAGTLLAFAAGLLALSLARLFAFGAAGAAALVAVQSLVPTWDQPLLSFLTGGLLGVLLFRLWVMALTSLAGAVLMTYTSLSLAERLLKLQAVAFAEKRTVLLNWICGALAVLGLGLQLWWNRGKPARAARKDRDRPRPRAEARPAAERADDPPPPKTSWWGWPPFSRKAS